MENIEYNIYVLMETRYIDIQKEKDELNNSRDDLFPDNWYMSKDYKLKTEILTEAIDNNITIKETKKYNELLEKEKNK